MGKRQELTHEYVSKMEVEIKAAEEAKLMMT